MIICGFGPHIEQGVEAPKLNVAANRVAERIVASFSVPFVAAFAQPYA